jgi:uncharacterized protein with FMN-binding domain
MPAAPTGRCRARSALFFGAGLAAALTCASCEEARVRRMAIRSVNLGSVSDGVRYGSFACGGFTYAVAVNVRDHRMVGIALLNTPATPRGRLAEGVIPRVLRRQTPDVEVIKGAEAESKALLKAVENALEKGARPARPVRGAGAQQPTHGPRP